MMSDWARWWHKNSSVGKQRHALRKYNPDRNNREWVGFFNDMRNVSVEQNSLYPGVVTLLGHCCMQAHDAFHSKGFLFHLCQYFGNTSWMLNQLPLSTQETSRFFPSTDQAIPWRPMFLSAFQRSRAGAAGSAAKAMLCCLWHSWIMMVKALTAGYFEVSHLLPEPTCLFPRVRGIQ